MAPQSLAVADSPRDTEAYIPGQERDDHGMRIVELLVAGFALLATVFLSLPK